MGVSKVSGRPAVESPSTGTTQRFNVREQMRPLARASICRRNLSHLDLHYHCELRTGERQFAVKANVCVLL